jgi:SAM-dependent methyltransferase
MALEWTDIFEPPAELEVSERFDDGRLRSGHLRMGAKIVPIKNGIPRFVPDDAYATNFGIQWNKFRMTQLDSHTKMPLTFNRFWNNTKWKPRELFGKKVLEVGSGAGRFTEVLLDAGADVVSFDLSSAVDANFLSNSKNGSLLLMQGSLYDLPLKNEFFDFVFCYGVLQHTPKPDDAFEIIFRKLKPGGRISIDWYLKTNKWEPWNQPKYFWRPLTTQMKPDKLLRIISAYIPFWLPLDTFVKKIPRVGNRLSALTHIPCWNYHYLPIPYSEKKEWAIMDTFDALGAAYDFPKTLAEMKQMVDRPDAEEIDVFYGSNGVVANLKKRFEFS